MSQNNSKPPIIITHDRANAFKTHEMEVTDGYNIIDNVSTFTSRHQKGICIMSGTGTAPKKAYVPSVSPTATTLTIPSVGQWFLLWKESAGEEGGCCGGGLGCCEGSIRRGFLTRFLSRCHEDGVAA
ncbi:AT-hook motif nuclear-localized protein 26-like [Vigna radiata var. radiata]|uniref:AT-hook motif nuclear-localized protein 26-like n=1 Tax=Vigna radiata var. radiata TaxID=3916 RepID=A0A1S3T961_VIGRR|nr:AT-hook motif nuclear-localized protein 26-like [Vigna radiata var. radiata]